MWSDRPSPCGVPTGEGPGRPNRVREVAVSQPAAALRPLTAAPPGSACRAGQPHLPALLHATGGQDTHRDADPRHAVIRELHQLALCTRTVNPVDSRVRQTEIRLGGIRLHTKYKLNVMNTNWDFRCLRSLFVSVEISFSHISSEKFGGSHTKAAVRETKMGNCNIFAALVSFALASV